MIKQNNLFRLFVVTTLFFSLAIFTNSALATNWGDFKKDHCVAEGKRQYSSILWNIPGGQSWEQACATTPASINNQHFPGADRCVNTGQMWGEFDVKDPSCGVEIVDVIDVSQDIDTSSRCYEIKEMTKGERVAVGSNGNVLRWARTGGEEQLFMVKPRLGGGYYFINKKYPEFLSVDRVTGNIRLWEFVGDETLYFHIEWTGTKNQFRLKENTKGEFVTVTDRLLPRGLGNIERWKDRGKDHKSQVFEFIPRDDLDCSLPEISVNVTGDFDALKGDATIRGFVDSHAHITSYEFLGGKMMHGKPFHYLGPLAALNGCGIGSTHGLQGKSDIIGNLMGGTKDILQPHETKGWPDLKGWSDHKQLSHMGYYYKWIERAHLSGLRLMVSYLVENKALCGAQSKLQKYLNPMDRTQPNKCNTMDSIRLQARRLKEMQDFIDTQAGGPGKGWFRLVTSSMQAREVIADGKLAVLMGVEASETFNCGLKDKKCDRDAVDTGLNELYELGVRAIFPAHKFDNQFSGSRVENTFINLGQWLSTGRFFETKECDSKTKGSHFASGLPMVGQIAVIKDVLGIGSINPQYNDDETFEHCNVHGLSQLGAYLINRMIDKKMLIDVDHLSAEGATAVMDIVEAREYSGVVSSHGWMNEGKKDETKDDEGLLHGNAIRLIQAGGYIAPYNSTISNDPEDHKSLNSKILRHLDELKKTLYVKGVGFGTDMSGLGDQPGPRSDVDKKPLDYNTFTSEFGFVFDKQVSGKRVFDLNKDGIAHYGLLADHLQDIRMQTRNEDSDEPDKVYEAIMHSAEAYLQMWGRAEVNKKTKHTVLPIVAEEVAEQTGIKITKAALDKIWKATGMVVDRPYEKQAFYVNTQKAANGSDGDCQKLQDGDYICIKAEKRKATAKNSFYITLTTQPKMWWKAVTMCKPDTTCNPDDEHNHIVTVDNEPQKKVLVSYADMFNFFVTLSKAKELGKPRVMYWIMNSYDLSPNYDWVIEWKKDKI